MKFAISTTKELYDKDYSSDVIKVEKYESLGIKFRTVHNSYFRTMAGQMIEINSLDELMKLVKDCGHPVVIETWKDVPSIEIYDDYRE